MTMISPIATLLSSSLFLAAPAVVPVVSEPAATHKEQAVAIDLELPHEDDMLPQVRGWILEEMTRSLREDGYTVDPIAEVRIQVIVHLTGEDQVNAAISAGIKLPHEEVLQNQRTFDCACSDNEIAQRLGRYAASTAGWLSTHEDEGEDPPSADVFPPPLESKPSTPPPFKHTLRWVGLGVGVAGLALGVTGGVLFSQIEDEPTFENDERTLQPVRKHGAIVPPVLMGVGGAALVTGVVLVVIDAKRAKAARPRKASVSPWVTPNHVGLSLAGRF